LTAALFHFSARAQGKTNGGSDDDNASLSTAAAAGY